MTDNSIIGGYCPRLKKPTIAIELQFTIINGIRKIQSNIFKIVPIS